MINPPSQSLNPLRITYIIKCDSYLQYTEDQEKPENERCGGIHDVTS